MDQRLKVMGSINDRTCLLITICNADCSCESLYRVNVGMFQTFRKYTLPPSYGTNLEHASETSRHVEINTCSLQIRPGHQNDSVL
jgi:hypothetical protein